QPSHIFTKAGVYQVRLIIFNPNSCKPTDTTFVQVTVDSNRVKAAFTSAVTDSCGPYSARFTNTSTYSAQPGAAARTTFNWYFGDGTSYTGVTPPVHNYTSLGTYTITLVMTDPNACNVPDSAKQVITINSSRVTAKLTSTDTV